MGGADGTENDIAHRTETSKPTSTDNQNLLVLLGEHRQCYECSNVNWHVCFLCNSYLNKSPDVFVPWVVLLLYFLFTDEMTNMSLFQFLQSLILQFIGSLLVCV